jgi:hypothetical protein
MADGNAVRGQDLSAGTAATNGTETRPVTYKNRKKERKAVTMQRSDGADIISDAARTVVNTARPSRSPTTTSSSGRR